MGDAAILFALLKEDKMHHTKQKAFSLIEAVLVLAFIAVLTAIAVPRLNFAFVDSTSAETQSQKIVSALCRTRRIALSDAAGNSSGYALQISGDTYSIVNLGNSTVIDTKQIEGDITISGGSEFRFGPLGNLLNSSSSELTVSSSDKTFTINITPATGMVKCSETQQSEPPQRRQPRPPASPFR